MTGYNGIFNVTNKKIKFYFTKSTTDKGVFIHITNPPVAYENESLNDETNRNKIEEGHFAEINYPLQLNHFFSNLGGTIEIPRQKPLVNFTTDYIIIEIRGFNAKTFMKNITYHLIQLTFYHLTILISNVISLKELFSKVKNHRQFKISRWMLARGLYSLKNLKVEYKGMCWKLKIFVPSINFITKSGNRYLVIFNGHCFTF